MNRLHTIGRVTRGRVVRRVVAGTSAGLVGLVVVLALAPSPAAAHGTLTSPISRTAACGTEGGGDPGSPACRAAVAASRPGAADDWDNLRRPDVDGRDRSVVPDGKLCSGGLTEFAGLDLARTDWPTTTVTPGAKFTFKYRTTIPHKGTFRLYVTRPGYDPTKRLRWADVESKPFLSVTDPKIVDGAYTMRGTLPTDLTGHHVIYAIWQNSSTPDTYYSCSDVLFRGTKPSSAAASPSPSAAGGSPVAEGGTAGHAGVAPSTTPSTAEAVEPSAAAVQAPAPVQRWPIVGAIGGVLGLIAVIAIVALRYRPRPRHRARH